MSSNDSWLRISLIVTAGILLMPGAVPAQSLPDGFVLEEIATAGFTGPPVGFTTLPDGRIILIQRDPAEVLVSAINSTDAVIIGTIPGVSLGSAERGLLGVDVDPGWPDRPYLYFHYTHITSTIHVTMYTVTGDLSDPTSTNLTLGDPYYVLNDISDLTVRHNGGTVRFGPNGMLFVSIGDDLRECDSSQDLALLGGDILRLDVSNLPGSGFGPPPKADITPPDNPFPGPGENERLVYLWGLRNPFRFTFDPATGDLFIGDVGASQFEEVDYAEYTNGGGENYGWPEWEAFRNTGIECDESPPYTDPIYVYGHDAGGEAIIAGPLYRPGGPDAYPPEYDGSFFLAENTAGWLRRIVAAGPSTWDIASAVPGQPSAENWAEDLGSLTDIQQGVDGSIYFCRIWGARGIYRIRYSPGTGVESGPTLPLVSRLRVIPNPAGTASGTTIGWEMSRQADVSLEVYDVTGRVVRHLLTDGLAAGPGSLHWDGRSDQGNPVPSGVYFVRLVEGDGVVAREKVLILR